MQRYASTWSSKTVLVAKVVFAPWLTLSMLTAPSVVPESAVSASRGSLFQMQTPRPPHHLLTQNLHLDRLPGATCTCSRVECAFLPNELSKLWLWTCSLCMGWNGLGCSRTWVLSSYPPRPCTPHSSMLPRSVTVSLLWDSCSSSASDSESCRDNLLLFKLPTRRMLDKEPPFFTWKLRVPLIWSSREPPILIFLLGTVLKE